MSFEMTVKDITWLTQPGEESMRLLAEGKVNAFLGFSPQPQELRGQKIGHVVVNSATDRPGRNTSAAS